MCTASKDKIFSNGNKSGFEEAYRQHTATFRAWLVAYGVGIPVFLASNEKVWEKFSQLIGARYIAYIFLSGVALQILLSLIDKYADWFCLSVLNGRRDKDSIAANFGVWWIANDWPSVCIDLMSIIFFAYSTLKIIQVFS